MLFVPLRYAGTLACLLLAAVAPKLLECSTTVVFAIRHAMDPKVKSLSLRLESPSTDICRIPSGNLQESAGAKTLRYLVRPVSVSSSLSSAT